jgi:ketol-acid reductoisomerase
VRIGLARRGASWARAERDGFQVQPAEEAATWADLIALLIPDQYHRQVFDHDLRQQLAGGKMLLLAHGFSVHFGEIVPPQGVDVALVAPVSPGHTMRRLFRQGVGVPAVFAVDKDATGQAAALALGYARALGCTRAGVVRSTFKEETETDLFGEQAVLVGGMAALIRTGFETLVRAGYQPELAYFECVHQVELIADLIQQGGLPYMYERVSDTAEYGGHLAGPRIVGDQARAGMEEVLAEIRDGTFARRMVEEFDRGAPNLARMRAEVVDGMETVGPRLRSMMRWLRSEDEGADEEGGRAGG